ncbi:MAG: efflux RND transporter periplasmic adaptor subunit [Thermoactinomyces sp.]
MKRSTKRMIAAVVALVVVGGIAIAFHSFTSNRTARLQEQLQNVAAVERGDITVKVNGSGEIASEKTARLKPERLGTIAEFSVENNSEVKKGDVLVTFEEKGMKSIVAPFDGTVYFSPEIEEGTRVSPEQTVATVFDPKKLEMVAKIDELDINLVKVKQKADILVDAFPDETFGGTVREVANMGEKAAGEIYSTFRVVIDIPDDQKFKPGMMAETEILAQEKKNVLLVPVEAVRKEEGKYYVQVVSGSTVPGKADTLKTTEKQVEIGVNNERMMEITSGLAEGEKVLLSVRKETASDSGIRNSFLERHKFLGGGNR